MTSQLFEKNKLKYLFLLHHKHCVKRLVYISWRGGPDWGSGESEGIHFTQFLYVSFFFCMFVKAFSPGRSQSPVCFMASLGVLPSNWFLCTPSILFKISVMVQQTSGNKWNEPTMKYQKTKKIWEENMKINKLWWYYWHYFHEYANEEFKINFESLLKLQKKKWLKLQNHVKKQKVTLG